MEPMQYLEITSARRNRNENHLPSQFEIPLSQSGQKSGENALDPVSLGSYELLWESNSFNTNTNSSNKMELIVQVEDITISGTGIDSIGNATSPKSIIINTTGLGTSGTGSLNTKNNYYRGAVASIGDGTTVSTDRRRILNYIFLGNNQAEIVFESAFSSPIIPGTTLLYIVDPTTIDSPNFTNPYFFIPCSLSISNQFNNYILFNQTICESRKVKSFDKITHLLGIQTDDSSVSSNNCGPITNWKASDTYSLRRENIVSCINNLDGDIINNSTTFTSFNLSVLDANSFIINNGSFLEIELAKDMGVLQFQAGGNGTTTVQLKATSNNSSGYYNGSEIRVLNGPAQGQITKIVDYNGNTKIATLKSGFSNSVVVGNTYDLILPQEAKKIIKYVDYRSNAIGGSTTTVNFPINNILLNTNFTNNYYNNLFIRITATGELRKITKYIVEKDYSSDSIISAIATIDQSGNPFTTPVSAGDAFTITSGIIEGGCGAFTYSISNQKAYILNFSYDNLYPFINAQSYMKNSQQWYEIALLNLILPNQILDSGFGGLISFYQYVYVEIENSNGSGLAGNNNIVSNNPNAIGMTFRATIDDVNNPVNSTFIKVDGDGMRQIVRFDPQDNLKFSVYLSTSSDPHKRELFKVLVEENYSPRPPNPIIQITAMFSLKKIAIKQDVVAQMRGV